MAWTPPEAHHTAYRLMLLKRTGVFLELSRSLKRITIGLN
jgi:hypothetical protein